MASAPREEASNKREEKPKIFNDPSSPPPEEQGWACSKRVRGEEAEEKNLDAVARKIRMLVRKVCERKQKHLRSQNRC